MPPPRRADQTQRLFELRLRLGNATDLQIPGRQHVVGSGHVRIEPNVQLGRCDGGKQVRRVKSALRIAASSARRGTTSIHNWPISSFERGPDRTRCGGRVRLFGFAAELS